MEVKKPIFCSLAFGSASINSYGEYIPCCGIRTNHFKMFKDGHYDDSFLELDPKFRINAVNLKETRKQLINGTWPEACGNCKDAEENNIGSMRTIWNKSLEEFNIPMVEEVDSKNIRYLDLTFGTKCNNKCMTCNPDLSDFWQDEYVSIWRIRPEQQKHFKRISIDEHTAIKLANDFPNVEFISFIGGEPTISDEHFKFLELLVEQNKSKNIKLSYVTNLTNLHPNLIALWKNFKHVHLSVSIDGYKKVNEYIRFPFKWSKIENNLKTLLSMVQEYELEDNKDKTRFSVGLSCTVSLYNATQCMDLFEYWIKTLIEYKTINNTLANSVGCFANHVTHPSYALLRLLSVEYRKQGIEKGQQILDFIDDYLNKHPGEIINHGFIESVKMVMKWLSEPQLVNSTFLSQCKHFITESDLYRNRRLQDHIPELYDELTKVWEQGIIPGDWYLHGDDTRIYVNSLVDGPGYEIEKNKLPMDFIEKINEKLHLCYPVRASSKEKIYAEKEEIKNLPDISVWWSQTVMDWPEVKHIANIVEHYVKAYLPNSIWYSSDIVMIEGNSKWFSPHVDTPHRFAKYNYNKELLGVQVIVALQDMNKYTASTGIIPHSQKQDFNINLCYNGGFNEYFLKNLIQPDLPKGSFLFYNCRVLHSSMPNPLTTRRPALLLNFLNTNIVEEIRAIDNIWKSNE